MLDLNALVEAEIAAPLRAEIDALKAERDALAEQLRDCQTPFTPLTDWAVYHGSGSFDKQGARVRDNVLSIVSADEGEFTRVYCRAVAQRTVVGTRTMQPGDYAAGGMASRMHAQYGRWNMDLRLNASKGTRAVALLWPEGRWPRDGELDFVENGGDIPDRLSTAITNHWAGPDGKNAQQVKRVNVNLTEWVNVDVEWRRDLYVVKYDGAEVYRTSDHVPNEDNGMMFLCVQTAVAGGGASPVWDKTGEARTTGFIDIRNARYYA